MKDLIEKIHQSNIFGVFIETGCGIPVASALLSVPGASDTVYMSESPYSRDYFRKEYNPDSESEKYRSVSPQYLRCILNAKKFFKLFTVKKINLLYAASFQLGEMNDKSTHGWICLKFNQTVRYYHLSIHEPLNRAEYIKRIGENGLKIILGKNIDIPDDCDVDIVLNEDLTPDYENTLNFIAKLKTKEQFSIFYPDKIERLESITRNYDSLIIFKGSFNPVQNAHYHIIKQAEKKFPDAKAFFMISFNAVQKGKQSSRSLMLRIRLLFELGYGVIISNNQFFRNNINFLRYKFPENKTVILAMGLDTFNRLLLDYPSSSNQQKFEKIVSDFKNVKFFCMNRKDNKLPEFIINDTSSIFSFEKSDLEELSSTKLRELLNQNILNEVKKIVPEKVFPLLVKEKWS